jgi:hypothetical protein
MALRSTGLIGLDEQARALCLPRSTTWKILKGDHKASGLSAMVISRMLSAPTLPPVVRTKILEYVREKTDGLYGLGKREVLRFSARIRYTNRRGICGDLGHPTDVRAVKGTERNSDDNEA